MLAVILSVGVDKDSLVDHCHNKALRLKVMHSDRLNKTRELYWERISKYVSVAN